VAIAGLALDLWSKDWAFHTLRQGGRHDLIKYVLELQTMLNDGALFGIGSGHTGLFLLASLAALALVLWMFAQSSPRRRALQLALGAILAGALGNMYDRVFVKLVPHPEPVPTATYPVYMQVIGVEDGYIKLAEYPLHESGLTETVPSAPPEVGFVRDFIKIPTTVPRWSWIPARLQGREAWPWVFNVADVLLVCGVVILAIHLWRDRKPREAQACATGSPGPGFSVDSSDRTA
jgi:signal peptidase II